MSLKSIRTVLPAPRPHWVGNGFFVFPVFADKAFSEELSPFLMFDYAQPKEFPANNSRAGVGKHPHRGFETVTLAFQGEVEHGDSVGNRGVIGPGDVQWMTAGRGIVHEEFHSQAFAKRGGVFEMCQLWVNLPREHKMTAPRYQEVLEKQVAVAPLRAYAEADGAAPFASAEAPAGEGSVRVIAGRFANAAGPAKTFTQLDMWDVGINAKNKKYAFDTVPGNNVIVFCRRGKVRIGTHTLNPQDVAICERSSGPRVVCEALEEGSQLLFLNGKPLDEPIANQGPFVMNTQQELMQAMQDYSAGKMGR